MIGTLVSLEVDTDWPHLVLKRKGFSRWSIPLSSITKFEVKGKSTGRWEEVPLPLLLSLAPLTEKLLAAPGASPDSAVAVLIVDGTKLTGRIVRQDDASILLITPSNLEVRIPLPSIVSIEPFRGRVVEGLVFLSDPNYSRLMFAPTGRPLRAGEGYFSDYYVFFPGLSYGITNQASLTAGISIFPGLGIDKQIITLAPKIGLQLSDTQAVSAGILYLTVPDEGAAGIAFAIGSLGHYDRSLTAGIGIGYTKDDRHADFEFAQHPIIMLGGNIRLSNSVALVSENWFITGEGLSLSEQPLGITLRFFGEQIAADVGFIIIGEVLKEGFPIPWLSLVYHFRG